MLGTFLAKIEIYPFFGKIIVDELENPCWSPHIRYAILPFDPEKITKVVTIS